MTLIHEGRTYRSREAYQARGKAEVVKIDSGLLAPHRYRLNPGLFRWKGRTLLGYRTGWGGSNLFVCELGEDLQPVGESVPLWPHHTRCMAGREDQRFFEYQGKLHIFFHGVEIVGDKTTCHPMIARLSPSLQVEHTWCVDYPQRAEWEKNWGPFVYEGELFAVYSIAPHRILHLTGGQAYPFTETSEERLPWTGGVLRGGAPPVLVGDEYWCFFHGGLRRGDVWTYNVGLYTFEARPPFRITRMIHDPILWPDEGNPPPEELKGKSVVFPCGAILDGEDWLVSYGHHDADCRIARFPRAELEKKLRRLLKRNPYKTAARFDVLRRIKELVPALDGWCPPRKAEAMAQLVWENKCKVCVEIGVWGGRSLIPVALALQEVGEGQAIGIDPWSKAECLKGENLQAHVDWLAGINQAFFDGLYRKVEGKILDLGLRHYCKLLRTSAEEGAARVPGAIDFLHIDGNHSEEASVKDVELFLPKVRAGGIIVFDDIGWETTKRAQEILAAACEVLNECQHDQVAYRIYRKT